MSSPTSTSRRPPAISTDTGLSAPPRTAATAAPVAPVPEAIVSPTPRSKIRACISASPVHDRLAHAVAGQLGLRAVGVVDHDLGHEAALLRLAHEQDAVRAHPGVPRADAPDPLTGELERKVPLLDDDVVVAERLPLLEAHGA